MFPLGTVLAPHMVLPLHVFEPRYRAMLDDLLGDGGVGEFGVALITRGHEVGGGDLRSDVGTVARILRAEQLDEDRWFVIAVGTQRIRIEGWLPDDPYPRAEVVALDDDHDEAADAALTQVLPRLRRVLALQSELGQADVAATFEGAEDPSTACWQAVVLAPLTPFDAQRVLAVDRCADRLELLKELLDDLEVTLRYQLDAE